MRVGDPFTLVNPQCHDARWEKMPRVLTDDLYCLHMELKLASGMSSSSTTSADAEPVEATTSADAEPVDASVSIKMGSGVPTSADNELGIPYTTSFWKSSFLKEAVEQLQIPLRDFLAHGFPSCCSSLWER